MNIRRRGKKSFLAELYKNITLKLAAAGVFNRFYFKLN